MRDIPTSQLPENCEVGDLLIFDRDSITIDKTGTNKLRTEIDDLMKELFEEE